MLSSMTRRSRNSNNLANGNTEWKAEAQEYLRQTHDIRTAAQQAAANAAIKAAEERVQEKLAAKRYGEASGLLPDVESTGGKSDSLRRMVEDAYHAELNSYKQQAASDPTAAGLKSVLAEVQDLARRAGPMNKDATDYELSLQNQLDRLNQPSVVPPPPPPPPPPSPTLRPTITAVVPMEQPWKDRIQEEMVVPAQFVSTFLLAKRICISPLWRRGARGVIGKKKGGALPTLRSVYFERVKSALPVPATSTDLLCCLVPSCQATTLYLPSGTFSIL